jgi:hypothetical protein
VGYEVVFDCTKASYSTLLFAHSGFRHWPLLVVCFVAAGALLLRMRHKLSRLVLATGFTILVIAFVLSSVWLAPNVSVTPTVVLPNVVTGNVSGFIPMPYGGHALERFCVQDACFEYSDYVNTGGFNHTSSHGGPIKDGLPVRVTYLKYPNFPGNLIVKLELKNVRSN